MANNQNRNQIDRNRYRTNGAAAYDMRYRGSAAPEIERPHLPDEQNRPVKRVRIKVKTQVSPFALLGTMVAVCLFVMVILGYVQLYEATTDVGKLENSLSALTQSNQMLHSQYEGKINLSEIEARAIGELGMTKPTAGQTVYFNLSGADRAIVMQTESESGITTVIDAVKEGVRSLVSYLS